MFGSIIPSLKNQLHILCTQFQAGQTANCWNEWVKLTSDKNILSELKGVKIECTETPTQHKRIEVHSNGENDIAYIDQEILKLLSKGVISTTKVEEGQILSNIFLRPKKDGTHRLILNLKAFNQVVEYHHFKMDSLRTIIQLIEKDCYMASIDIKDAYYSFPIRYSDRKFLCFKWGNQIYQFTCLPNGLSSAPRKFTKMLKVPLSALHRQGHISVGHLDDFYMQGQNYELCAHNVIDTMILFSKLGLITHPNKSNFIPSQEITILGFMINSRTMTVRLTVEKAEQLKQDCMNLMGIKSPPIREVARIIGKIVSSFPGTDHGPLYYRDLEQDKSLALKQNKGDYDAKMVLSSTARLELDWWIKNITSTYHVISHGQPSIQITTDASLLGWGAECAGVSTGGVWTLEEAKHHINGLELMASLFGLKTFAREMTHVHIRLRLDNTTAVSVINHMGTSHSNACNAIGKSIWEWCLERHIWISAAYLPGKYNTTADAESRKLDDKLEWMLDKPTLQESLRTLDFEPEIDLFASRLNNQFPRYAAYKPDPNAEIIDAFTMQWKSLKFYAFPPFSVIPLVLNKMCKEKAEGIVVIPDWPTQSWYPKAMQMLQRPPVRLKARASLLHLAGQPNQVHPLHRRLNLLVCLLLGKL